MVEYVSAKVSAVAGYFDKLFAKEIFTETICIKKSDGTDICLNGDQVENMLNATEAPLTTGSSGGSSSSTPNIPPSEQQGEVTGTSTEESIPDIDTSGDADVESPPSSLGDTEEGTEDVVPDLETPPEEQSVPDQNLPITLSEE